MPPNEPKSTPPSVFTETLRRMNNYPEEELQKWLFLPGMGFGEKEKWWKPGSFRTAPHEGLDITTYLDRNGSAKQLPAVTKIPPLLSGIVAGRTPDFLGETIILAHNFYDQNGRQLHSFYAHLQPAETPRIASIIGSDSLLGKIALPGKHNIGCPPHLHLSLAWVDELFSIRDFRWTDFHAGNGIYPENPLYILSRA